MPETPVRLKPAECPRCGATSYYVVPLPITNDNSVDLAWFCRDCHYEWPVIRRDAGEFAVRTT